MEVCARTSHAFRVRREFAPAFSRQVRRTGSCHHLPAACQPPRLLTRAHAKRATEEDERLIEEMKRAAEKGDVMEGSAAGVLVKVLAVAAAVGIVVILAYLAQPVIQNTVESFPSR